MEADYLQATEVTQGQWKKVMVDNPSSWDLFGDHCPVRMLSLEDARNFTNKLNQLEKTKAYRLPSEAEWEYACRAGTTCEFPFGDDASKLGDYVWYGDNSNKTTHKVATKAANPWGLYAYTAMSGSGSRTTGTKAIKVRQMTARPGPINPEAPTA